MSAAKCPPMNVSYKPQKISPKSQTSVRALLHEKIRDAYMHQQFLSDVMKPLKIEELYDQEIQNLSGTLRTLLLAWLLAFLIV